MARKVKVYIISYMFFRIDFFRVRKTRKKHQGSPRKHLFPRAEVPRLVTGCDRSDRSAFRVEIGVGIGLGHK